MKAAYAGNPEPQKQRTREAYANHRSELQLQASIRSSVCRPSGATSCMPAFEAVDLQDALLPIAACHCVLETTKWSTCVQCWRGWYAVEANSGTMNNALVADSKILPKSAIPVAQLADATYWENPKLQHHVECQCGGQHIISEAGSESESIRCATCGRSNWRRQLVVCRGLSYAG